MIVVTILNGFDLIGGGYLPLWIAGIASWLAALLLFIDTSRVLKIQVSVILMCRYRDDAIRTESGGTRRPGQSHQLQHGADDHDRGSRFPAPGGDS